MKNYIIIFLILLMASCKTDTAINETKAIETEFFSIDFRNDIDIKKANNAIILDDRDTLYYKTGIAISNLSEREPKIVYIPPSTNEEQDKEMIAKLDSMDNTFVTRSKLYDIDKYRKQNVNYYEIDGRSLKHTYPRANKGITGVYVDSLYYGCVGDVCGNVKLNLYGTNVSDKSRDAIHEAISTLKFKQKKK